MSDSYEDPYDTPFGMIEYCLTVTAQQLINEHVLGLHGMSTELADEAPPALATKLRALAAVAAEQRDDLDGLIGPHGAVGAAPAGCPAIQARHLLPVGGMESDDRARRAPALRRTIRCR